MHPAQFRKAKALVFTLQSWPVAFIMDIFPAAIDIFVFRTKTHQ